MSYPGRSHWSNASVKLSWLKVRCITSILDTRIEIQMYAIQYKCSLKNTTKYQISNSYMMVCEAMIQLGWEFHASVWYLAGPGSRCSGGGGGGGGGGSSNMFNITLDSHHYLTHLWDKISITFFPALHIITELIILYTILYRRCSNTQRQCEIRWKILTTYSLPPSMIATEPGTTAYCNMQHDLNPPHQKRNPIFILYQLWYELDVYKYIK